MNQAHEEWTDPKAHGFMIDFLLMHKRLIEHFAVLELVGTGTIQMCRVTNTVLTFLLIFDNTSKNFGANVSWITSIFYCTFSRIV